MTPRNRDTLPEGERRKDAAHLLIEARREWYLRASRRAMLSALLANGTATADDVRAAVELPDGVNPKAFGAVPGVLARTGIIRRVGFVPTERPEGHARHVSKWRLVDGPKAEAWLAAHRPLPELTTGDQLPLPFPEYKTPAAPSGKNQAAGAVDGSTPSPTGKEPNHGKA